MSDTKLTGDISEQRVVLRCLEMGIGVSIPLGDRLPYDLVVDAEGKLSRIQVKTAWYDRARQTYFVGTRTAKTNRSEYRYEKYSDSDFDYAVVVVQEYDVYYVIPACEFNSYKSGITLVETHSSDKRRRVLRSLKYREAWNLLYSQGHSIGNNTVKSSKFGEAGDVVIPSQAL